MADQNWKALDDAPEWLKRVIASMGDLLPEDISKGRFYRSASGNGAVIGVAYDHITGKPVRFRMRVA